MEESNLEFDADGHGYFRDLCLSYGDDHRGVFLESILEWFLGNADKDELAAIRTAVTARAADLGKGGKRGRPSAEDNKDWLVKVKVETWQHIVEGHNWAQVAKTEEMDPTKANIRTLQRRQDQYAAMIWRACSRYCPTLSFLDVERGYVVDLELLEKHLETKRFQHWLWFNVGLPFSHFPQKDMSEGCRKIVLELAFRGMNADARELDHLLHTRRR